VSSLERILPFLAPLSDLLNDPTVTEIMVNGGGRRIFVEQAGQMRQIHGRTVSEKNLLTAAKVIARSVDCDITDESPILDARMEDGSRVAVMLEGCSVDGTTMTIRRFGHRYSLAQLVDAGELTAAQADQLIAWVHGRKTILISGSTGTGKTTLLNALAQHIPDDHRLILLEDTSEIFIEKPNVVRFEVRREKQIRDNGGIRVVPGIPMAALLKAALRHRPDRIILGEVRGAEAFDLLQALNTGHMGSLTTIHANTAPDALSRLGLCVLSAGTGLPYDGVQKAVAMAIGVVVHIDRRGRNRIVTDVIEVQGYRPQTDQWEFTRETAFQKAGAA
jgi:pilus assembly protein CpaF